MAVGAAESDCVEFDAVPTVTGFELFPSSTRQHSPDNLARNSRPSCLCHAPYGSSGLIYDARNENFRTPTSSVTEYPNPNLRQTIFHVNSKLARHPWTDSAEFIELWSDIPSENVNDDWTDRGETDSENDSALMSSFATDSRISWKLSRQPWIASEEFVEPRSDIPNEFHSSRNLHKDRRKLMDQNNRTSISNPANLKYDSSVISWDLSNHRWSESEEFVELWSDIPSEYDTSKNGYKDEGELMNQNNHASVSNIAADLKYDSSVISWDLSKHPWLASKDFVVLWSDIPDEFDESQNQSEDQNGSSLSKGMVDRDQYLSAHSGFFENSCFEAETLTEVSSITPEDSISNKNYLDYPENNKAACCRLLSECFCHPRSFAMRLINHICFLVMMILLCTFSSSAIYMGMAYFGTCPANVVVQHFVYWTGMAGVLSICLYVGYRFAEETRKERIKYAAKLFLIITSILLLIEMILFYTMSPSLENAENYCDETFYNFTFYANIAAAGIVFLSVLLQFTSLKHLVDNLAF